jgi:hypothetical protein
MVPITKTNNYCSPLTCCKVKPRKRRSSWPLCKVAPLTASSEIRHLCPLSPSYGSCPPPSAIQLKFDADEGNFVEVQRRWEELEKQRRLLSEVVGASERLLRPGPSCWSPASRALRAGSGSSRRNLSARPSSSLYVSL